MGLIHRRATRHPTALPQRTMRRLREFIILLQLTARREPTTHHIITRLQWLLLITGTVRTEIITIILIIGTVDGNRGRETNNPAGFDSAGLFFIYVTS